MKLVISERDFYMIKYLSQFNLIWLGIIASMATGLCTGVGSIPIFFTKNISRSYLMLF